MRDTITNTIFMTCKINIIILTGDKIQPITYPFIVKTHNYRGEKTTDDHIKLSKELNKTNIHLINTTMFKPAHLEIVTESGQVVYSTKTSNETNMLHIIATKFLEEFANRYNNHDILKTVDILFNATTFKPEYDDNYKLIYKIQEDSYQRDKIIELFNKFISDFRLSGMARKNADTWVNLNV